MSAGLVAGVALLGALAGGAAVPLAHRVVGRSAARSGPAAKTVGRPADPGSDGPPQTVGRPADPRSGGPPETVGRPGDPGSDGLADPIGCSGDPAGSVHGTRAAPSKVGRGAAVSAGAVVFGGLAAARGADPALPALLLVAAVGLALAAGDLVCLRLPDPLVGAAALGGGLGLAGAALVGGTPGRLLTALAGAAVSFAGYVLLALLPGARLGFGDVKLAAALGLPLGWLGWPTLGLGLLLPHVLNGVVVLALLAARRVRRDTPLPFGPALLAGAWLAALLA